MSTLIACDCGNVATEALASGVAACVWCAAHDGHRTPVSMSFGRSHLGGNPVAECSRCAFVSVYWECGCELAHDCVVMA